MQFDCVITLQKVLLSMRLETFPDGIRPSGLLDSVPVGNDLLTVESIDIKSVVPIPIKRKRKC